MGKRSNFERKPRDFYSTPLKAVPPLIRICATRQVACHQERRHRTGRTRANRGRIAMMTAEQVCNILVAGNDPMTTTGPQIRTLVEELFGRVNIATMRAGVELAEAKFERLNERLDEPGYLVAAILVRTTSCVVACAC